MNAKQLQRQLEQAMLDAREASMATKTDYDAGRYDGLKQAVEILERLVERDLER